MNTKKIVSLHLLLAITANILAIPLNTLCKKQYFSQRSYKRKYANERRKVQHKKPNKGFMAKVWNQPLNTWDKQKERQEYMRNWLENKHKKRNPVKKKRKKKSRKLSHKAKKRQKSQTKKQSKESFLQLMKKFFTKSSPGIKTRGLINHFTLMLIGIIALANAQKIMECETETLQEDEWYPAQQNNGDWLIHTKTCYWEENYEDPLRGSAGSRSKPCLCMKKCPQYDDEACNNYIKKAKILAEYYDFYSENYIERIKRHPILVSTLIFVGGLLVGLAGGCAGNPILKTVITKGPQKIEQCICSLKNAIPIINWNSRQESEDSENSDHSTQAIESSDFETSDSYSSEDV